jgi:peroxiredoxin
MISVLDIAITLGFVALAAGSWLGWQLLRQNGRMLLRLDDLEKRLDEMEFGEQEKSAGLPLGAPAPEPIGNGEERATRFGNRSLAHSKIKRDGLKAGTPAPDFRLPRLDGGELSLGDMRGRRVLLVFSNPHCGPCNTVVPELQKFHRHHPEISVVMISRGESDENRAKVKEHRLTIPVLLQQQWEISRLYAMFATPVAYLINESGVILQDVAVGVEPILALMEKAKEPVEQHRPMTKVA